MKIIKKIGYLVTNLLWALTDWSRFAPNTYTLRGIKAQTYRKACSLSFLSLTTSKLVNYCCYKQQKKDINDVLSVCLWALTDSNRRPSACKADALNQLS